MSLMNIVERSYDYFHSLSYKTMDSFPLLTNDPTLLFVNSTIAPFKELLLKGENFEKTFLTQKCFRHHYNSTGLFGFQMLGIISGITEMEETQNDFLNFLANIIGIERGRLHVVLNKNDTLLYEYCKEVFSSRNIHFLKRTDDAKYSIRWSFGEGNSLTGIGLTVVAESAILKKCCIECSVFCSCNYYLPLGNFILIKSGNSKYVEIGFGVEAIEAAMGNSDYYLIEPYNTLVSYFMSKRFSTHASQELTRCYAGGAILLKEGVVQGNKGAQYVLKKMIRTIYEGLINADVPLSEVGKLLQDIIVPETKSYWGTYDGFKKILVTGFPEYKKIVEKGMAKLESLSEEQIRSNGELVQQFYETYGVPRRLIEKIIKTKLETIYNGK